MRVRSAMAASHLHVKVFKRDCSETCDTMPERGMEEHQNQMQQRKLDRSHDWEPRQNLVP